MINQSYASPKFNGEPSPEALANGLATLGRYGDSYMVHATDGETLIPPEIFEANPKLKEDLFVQMRQMGVRDPERFVVGNSLNSINPITGQPEFFFKKIFRAVKKVFKKALPVIAPIVGNMIAPGIGGLIASGLVTKLQGGSWGDVAKGALLSYGLGALGQGVTGAMSGKGFMASLGKGLTAPLDAGKALFSGGLDNPLAQGIFGTGKALDLGLGFSGGSAPQQKVFGSETLGDVFPTYQTGLGGAGSLQPASPSSTESDFLRQASGQPHDFARSPSGQPVMLPKDELDALRQVGAIDQNNAFTEKGFKNWNQYNAAKSAAPVSGGVKGDGWSTTTAPDGTVHNVFRGQIVAPAEAPAPRLWEGWGGETAAKMLGEYGVPAALSGLTYFLADDEPELDPEDQAKLSDPQRSAYDQYLQGRQANPDFKNTPEGQALLLQAGVVPSTDPEVLARATGATFDEAQTWLGSMYGQLPPAYPAASGMRKGGIMTLQGGGEIMGPGSGTSDSIPARLSDGEFVMTADAVRGAGNGSRDMGAARMYDIMSRFERAA